MRSPSQNDCYWSIYPRCADESTSYARVPRSSPHLAHAGGPDAGVDHGLAAIHDGVRVRAPGKKTRPPPFIPPSTPTSSTSASGGATSTGTSASSARYRSWRCSRAARLKFPRGWGTRPRRREPTMACGLTRPMSSSRPRLERAWPVHMGFHEAFVPPALRQRAIKMTFVPVPAPSTPVTRHLRTTVRSPLMNTLCSSTNRSARLSARHSTLRPVLSSCSGL